MTICLALAVSVTTCMRVADFGQRFQAQHFGRHRRPTSRIGSAVIVDHGAHASEDRAADEVIADSQRAVAHQHRRHRTASAIELRFEHRAHRGTRRIGLQIQHVRDQQNHFEQQVEIRLGFGRNRDHDDVAAPIFSQQATIGQLLLDAIRLRIRACRFY